MKSSKDTYVTKNFRRGEFIDSEVADRMGIDNTPPFEIMLNIINVAKWLQHLRDGLCEKYQRDVVIIVSSGYRCAELNKRIGGAKTSAHLQGLAADITAIGITPYQLTCDILEIMPTWDQVILEFDRWVHVGVCAAGQKNRQQTLEAIRQENSFGKTTTRYIQFNKRDTGYAFG